MIGLKFRAGTILCRAIRQLTKRILHRTAAHLTSDIDVALESKSLPRAGILATQNPSSGELSMHKAMPGILILAAAFMVHGVRTAKKVRKNRTHAGSSVFWLWCERHADTQPSPLLARRGGRDIKRNIAKPPLMERTGWWFNFNKSF